MREIEIKNKILRDYMSVVLEQEKMSLGQFLNIDKVCSLDEIEGFMRKEKLLSLKKANTLLNTVLTIRQRQLEQELRENKKGGARE